MNLLGVCLIFAACTLAGFAYDSYEAKRVLQLEQLLMGFEVIKGEIDYQLTPLAEALEVASDMTEHGVEELFITFSRKLAACRETDAKKMWLDSIDETKEGLSLKEEDYKVLSSFGNATGYLDKEFQKKNIEWMLERLSQKKALAQSEHEKKSKLYKGLGILVGLSLGIVLI